MKRCHVCVKEGRLDTACMKCKDLNQLDSLLSGDCTELPKIDMGQAVTKEEKDALWPIDEKRIDIIGPNGNDGDHYETLN